MSEKQCTDCGADVEAHDMAEHMLEEHGVEHYPQECPDCTSDEPCARAKALMGVEG